MDGLVIPDVRAFLARAAAKDRAAARAEGRG